MLEEWNCVELQAMTWGGPRTEKLWYNYALDRTHWAIYAGKDFTDRQRIKRKAARWASNDQALPSAERLALVAALMAVEAVETDECRDRPHHARHGHPGPDKAGLEKLPKATRIAMILEPREETRSRLEEKDKPLTELSAQLAILQGKLDKDQAAQTIKAINQHVNQPTSKKPEWDKDGLPKLATKSHNTQTQKTHKRNKRTGCGNLGKSGLTPDATQFIPLASCPGCGNDLGGRKGKVDRGRIVEEIPPPAEKTTVFNEVTESKWGDHCKTMVSSTSDKALPGSDIGLNAMSEMADLWVMCARSFPKIRELFISFKTLRLSTAGLARIMIRLSGILQPV